MTNNKTNKEVPTVFHTEYIKDITLVFIQDGEKIRVGVDAPDVEYAFELPVCHQQPEKEKEGDYGMGGGITNCAEPSNEEVTAKNVWVGLSGTYRLSGKPNRENWEEKFDKEFVDEDGKEDVEDEYWNVVTNDYKIKEFIKSLLLSERTALVEDIEKLKKDEKSKRWEFDDELFGDYEHKQAYNSAIADIINFLTNHK